MSKEVLLGALVHGPWLSHVLLLLLGGRDLTLVGLIAAHLNHRIKY